MNELVTLRFNGLMLEKLVERATKEGVRFKSVERLAPKRALLVTDRAGAEKLLDIAKRFSLDIRQLSSKGPGAILRNVKRRWTLPAAIAIAGMIAVGFLSRVWIIDVNMLDGGDQIGIRQALDDMGVHLGMRLDKAHMDSLQTDIKARCPSYAYVGARLMGVRLLIEATETFPAPDVYDHRAARDIRATRDALVQTLDVLAGTAMVAPGQYVRKGDLLIAGMERDSRETTRGVNAMGSVIASVWLSGEAALPLTERVITPTGRKRVESEIRLWDYAYPVKSCESFESEAVEEAFYPIVGIIAPLGIVKRVHHETTARTQALDIDEVKREAARLARDLAVSQAPPDSEASDEWMDFSVMNNETLIARVVVEVMLDIADN